MFDFSAMKDAAEKLEKFMQETEAKLHHLEDLLNEVLEFVDDGRQK
jgi:hypothetical protein